MTNRCGRCGKAYETSADLKEHECNRHVICDDCNCENDYFSTSCWYCNSENLSLIEDKDTEEPQKEVK